MQTASSANRTWSDVLSATEYTATVLMPNSLHARMTRNAISPRLAIKTFCIMISECIVEEYIPNEWNA